MLQLLRRIFIGEVADPPDLDFLPLNARPRVIDAPSVDKPKAPPPPPDWEAKLKAAAARFKKPFKCAADGLPREVIVEGKAVTVSPSDGVNVTKLSERKRK
jgi:hypothetical protein